MLDVQELLEGSWIKCNKNLIKCNKTHVYTVIVTCKPRLAGSGV